RCSPFPITWLYILTSAISICTSNRHTGTYNAHHKTHLVKVVEIAVVTNLPTSLMPFRDLDSIDYCITFTEVLNLFAFSELPDICPGSDLT
ncbi:hypothetical protein HI914_01913, partial [Erysiphe necator]